MPEPTGTNKQRVIRAYYITQEILQHAVFAEEDLKQRLLNIATLIFCQDVFGLSAAERADIDFNWEDLPFRVFRVPVRNTLFPVKKLEESKQNNRDLLISVFSYLQSFYENFTIYRPLSIQGPFQTYFLNLGSLREKHSFDDIKDFIFNLWQHSWFYLPDYPAIFMHSLYRNKLFEIDTDEELRDFYKYRMSREEFEKEIHRLDHAITLLEPYFIMLGEKNRSSNRDIRPLKDLALKNIQDCERNLIDFRSVGRNMSEWIQFVHVLYVPYMLSVFLLKEVYYSLEDKEEQYDVEREMCIADERRTDISDFLKNPYLISQSVLSAAAEAYRKRGEKAAKRVIRYHFEGRVFLPLSYIPEFVEACKALDYEKPIRIEYEGLSTGHRICFEESKKYTESLLSKEE